VTGWGNYVIETPSNGGVTRSPTRSCGTRTPEDWPAHGRSNATTYWRSRPKGTYSPRAETV